MIPIGERMLQLYVLSEFGERLTERSLVVLKEHLRTTTFVLFLYNTACMPYRLSDVFALLQNLHPDALHGAGLHRTNSKDSHTVFATFRTYEHAHSVMQSASEGKLTIAGSTLHAKPARNPSFAVLLIRHISEKGLGCCTIQCLE